MQTGQQDQYRSAVGRVVANVSLAAGLYLAPAAAQDYVIRDAQGRIVETLKPGASGDLIRRDPSGKHIGTAHPGMSDRLELRDSQGRFRGTIQASIGGHVTGNRGGAPTVDLKPGLTGIIDSRDASGRRTGTVEKR